MTIVQPLEDSNILLKGVTETIKNESKEQKEGFLSMLLDTSGASLLGNLWERKRIVGAGSGNKKRKRIVRAGSGNKKGTGIVRAGTGKEWYHSLKNDLILWQILKYKSIMKMNQDLMMFFQEIIFH